MVFSGIVEVTDYAPTSQRWQDAEKVRPSFSRASRNAIGDAPEKEGRTFSRMSRGGFFFGVGASMALAGDVSIPTFYGAEAEIKPFGITGGD